MLSLNVYTTGLPLSKARPKLATYHFVVRSRPRLLISVLRPRSISILSRTVEPGATYLFERKRMRDRERDKIRCFFSHGIRISPFLSAPCESHEISLLIGSLCSLHGFVKICDLHIAILWEQQLLLPFLGFFLPSFSFTSSCLRFVFQKINNLVSLRRRKEENIDFGLSMSARTC